MPNLTESFNLSGDEEYTDEFYLPSCRGVVVVVNAGVGRQYQLQYNIDIDWIAYGSNLSNADKIRWVGNIPAGKYRIRRGTGSSEHVIKKVFLLPTHVDGNLISYDD